ncbi:MAG: DNA-binding transcriptional regulator [Verrucomicrobiales bacterium]|nr:DNA-binding transcriptional regulator [Verrucomicrobiales bacterium]
MPKPVIPTSHRRVPRVLLLVESSRSSGRSLLRGIADYARIHGPWAFYWEPGGLEKAWPRLRALDVSGIILRDVENLDEVKSCGIPAVVVGHNRLEIQGLANVVTDSDGIAHLAAEHLLARGFRHFAYCGLEGLPWSTLRGDAFRRCIERAGHAVDVYPPPGARVRRGWSAERRSMADWVSRLPKPLGVMACNDDRGEQVVEACKIAGLEVPDEVAIVGADNDDLVCDLCDPPMSSVAIHFERAGFEAAQVLDQRMRGRHVPTSKIVVQASHVVTRRSTDILAVADPRLATALRFIRDHANEAISVPDVARAAGLSRRVLEKRFQLQLRRSALSEIRRIRVSQLCQLLAETSQPISQISQTLGYTGPEHLARYFRREKDMSPLAYRQRYGRK